MHLYLSLFLAEVHLYSACSLVSLCVGVCPPQYVLCMRLLPSDTQCNGTQRDDAAAGRCRRSTWPARAGAAAAARCGCTWRRAIQSTVPGQDAQAAGGQRSGHILATQTLATHALATHATHAVPGTAPGESTRTVRGRYTDGTQGDRAERKTHRQTMTRVVTSMTPRM